VKANPLELTFFSATDDTTELDDDNPSVLANEGTSPKNAIQVVITKELPSPSLPSSPSSTRTSTGSVASNSPTNHADDNEKKENEDAKLSSDFIAAISSDIYAAGRTDYSISESTLALLFMLLLFFFFCVFSCFPLEWHIEAADAVMQSQHFKNCIVSYVTKASSVKTFKTLVRVKLKV
jgi:hypothetical protein